MIRSPAPRSFTIAPSDVSPATISIFAERRKQEFGGGCAIYAVSECSADEIRLEVRVRNCVRGFHQRMIDRANTGAGVDIDFFDAMLEQIRSRRGKGLFEGPPPLSAYQRPRTRGVLATGQ